MGELQYSIFRYAPSLISGEKINLAAAFYFPETGYREFFHISKWSRVSAFDDTLNITLLKALMLDIRDEIGTQIDSPSFDLKEFCLRYDSELYFDKCETLVDISTDDISSQIELIKKMYFQFEYDISDRPIYNDQKKFLRQLLQSKHVKYSTLPTSHGMYDAEIKYDYTFGDYGVVFFDFNVKRIDNKVMNKVKAWAWNAQNATDGLKLIVLYDLDDSDRADVKPAIDILNSAAFCTFNIHQGFSDVSQLIEPSAS